MNRKNCAGFTLLELLIVIGIIGLLVGLLGGGIRRSIENGKKRTRSTEAQGLQSAIMTYWHDTGKPPIELTRGKYEYTFDEDNNKVFERLADPNHNKNPLQKTYVDIRQLRTLDSSKKVVPMRSPSSPIVDYRGKYYIVKIDMTVKDASVTYKED